MTSAAFGSQVTPAAGHDAGDSEKEFLPSPAVQVFDPAGRMVTGSSEPVTDGSLGEPNRRPSKPKPLIRTTKATDGSNPKLPKRTTLSWRPNVPSGLGLNGSRVVSGGRKVSLAPLRKPFLGDIKEELIKPKESNSEELTEQPDVGMGVQGGDPAPESSEPDGSVRSQDNKCMNKIKVTHIRTSLKDRRRVCKKDGGVVEVNSDQGGEADVDYSPDPLHKLLTDTFHSLNVTTFSVHLSKTTHLSEDEEVARKQILGGLRPLSSYSSSSSSLSAAASHSSPSSSSQSSAEPSSSASPSAPPSLVTLSATIAPPSPPSPSSASASSQRHAPPVAGGSAYLWRRAAGDTWRVVTPQFRRCPSPRRALRVTYRRVPLRRLGSFQRCCSLFLPRLCIAMRCWQRRQPPPSSTSSTSSTHLQMSLRCGGARSRWRSEDS